MDLAGLSQHQQPQRGTPKNLAEHILWKSPDNSLLGQEDSPPSFARKPFFFHEQHLCVYFVAFVCVCGHLPMTSVNSKLADFAI